MSITLFYLNYVFILFHGVHIFVADVLTRLRHEQGSEYRLSVLDLCSGKGGDLLKWRKGRISSLVCAGTVLPHYFI